MATERDTRRADPRALSTRPDGISTMRNSLIPPYSCRAQGPRGVVAIDGSRAEAIAFLSEQGAPAPLSLVEQAEAEGQAEATTADGTLLWVDVEQDEQPQTDHVEGHQSPIADRAEAIIDAATEEAYVIGRDYAEDQRVSGQRYASESPLSGEWAGAPTDRTVYVEAMTAAGASVEDRNAIREALSPEVVDTIAEAWLDGYGAADWLDFEEEYPLLVCVDCALVAANGSDDWAEATAPGQPEPLALLTTGQHLVTASEEEHPGASIAFSSAPCDACGTRLAGARMRAVIIER